MIGIHGHLHHIEVVPSASRTNKPMREPFGMHEDQCLRFAVAAGFADDALPPGASFVSTSWFSSSPSIGPGKCSNSATWMIADAAVGRLARYEADEAEEGDARGVNVISALDGSHHAVEASSPPPASNATGTSKATKQTGINRSRLIRAALRLVLFLVLVFVFILAMRTGYRPARPVRRCLSICPGPPCAPARGSARSSIPSARRRE